MADGGGVLGQVGSNGEGRLIVVSEVLVESGFEDDVEFGGVVDPATFVD